MAKWLSSLKGMDHASQRYALGKRDEEEQALGNGYEEDQVGLRKGLMDAGHCREHRTPQESSSTLFMTSREIKDEKEDEGEKDSCGEG